MLWFLGCLQAGFVLPVLAAMAVTSNSEKQSLGKQKGNGMGLREGKWWSCRVRNPPWSGWEGWLLAEDAKDLSVSSFCEGSKGYGELHFGQAVVSCISQRDNYGQGLLSILLRMSPAHCTAAKQLSHYFCVSLNTPLVHFALKPWVYSCGRLYWTPVALWRGRSQWLCCFPLVSV